MALIDIKWDPTERELRQFGSLLFPAFLAIVGAIVLRRSGSIRAAVTIWAAGAAIGLVGLAAPRLLRPLFVGMMVVSYPIGFVVSHVVLAVLYFGIVTPIGFLVRTLSHDPMERALDRAAKTYWVTRKPVTDTKRYFRQF